MKLVPFIVSAVITALSIFGLSEVTIPAISEVFYAYETNAVVTTQAIVHAVAVWFISGFAIVGAIVGTISTVATAFAKTGLKKLSIF